MTLEEQQFIRDHMNNMSYIEIAKTLNREARTVRAWIIKNLGFTPEDRKEVEAFKDLKERAYWGDLVEQFTEDELKTFSFHWRKMWSQFRDDVFHTEEIQIVDTIKMEILMNRILKSQKTAMEKIEEIEDEMARVREEMAGAAAMERDALFRQLMDLDRQIAAIHSSKEAMSNDYKNLQDKKSGILKTLKATREQRVKEIESAKTTFAGLLKKIISDPIFRENLGVEMEKMRLATEVERARLTKEHKYMDGSWDVPIQGAGVSS